MSRASTDRQKFQRAFAQSLLCPIDDLLNHVDPDSPTEKQIQRAAGYYHVSKKVVRTVLVNKGFIPREYLEARFETA